MYHLLCGAECEIAMVSWNLNAHLKPYRDIVIFTRAVHNIVWTHLSYKLKFNENSVPSHLASVNLLTAGMRIVRPHRYMPTIRIIIFVLSFFCKYIFYDAVYVIFSVSFDCRSLDCHSQPKPIKYVIILWPCWLLNIIERPVVSCCALFFHSLLLRPIGGGCSWTRDKVPLLEILFNLFGVNSKNFSSLPFRATFDGRMSEINSCLRE